MTIVLIFFFNEEETHPQLAMPAAKRNTNLVVSYLKLPAPIIGSNSSSNSTFIEGAALKNDC